MPDIRIHLSDEDHDTLKALTSAAGVSIPTYIRGFIRGSIYQPLVPGLHGGPLPADPTPKPKPTPKPTWEVDPDWMKKAEAAGLREAEEALAKQEADKLEAEMREKSPFPDPESWYIEPKPKMCNCQHGRAFHEEYGGEYRNCESCECTRFIDSEEWAAKHDGVPAYTMEGQMKHIERIKGLAATPEG